MSLWANQQLIWLTVFGRLRSCSIPGLLNTPRTQADIQAEAPYPMPSRLQNASAASLQVLLLLRCFPFFPGKVKNTSLYRRNPFSRFFPSPSQVFLEASLCLLHTLSPVLAYKLNTLHRCTRIKTFCPRSQGTLPLRRSSASGRQRLSLFISFYLF